MGAGARLAEERDRWEDHWRVVDLEQEGELLLDILLPSEELRTAVPGLRMAADGESAVLIGITDQRVLVVGRWWVAEPGGGSRLRTEFSVEDVTCHVYLSTPTASLEVAGGTIKLDLDDAALDRLWASMGDLAGTTGVG
jgi:hypothetical protein